jgi:hypothetical protein
MVRPYVKTYNATVMPLDNVLCRKKLYAVEGVCEDGGVVLQGTCSERRGIVKSASINFHHITP